MSLPSPARTQIQAIRLIPQAYLSRCNPWSHSSQSRRVAIDDGSCRQSAVVSFLPNHGHFKAPASKFCLCRLASVAARMALADAGQFIRQLGVSSVVTLDYTTSNRQRRPGSSLQDVDEDRQRFAGRPKMPKHQQPGCLFSCSHEQSLSMRAAPRGSTVPLSGGIRRAPPTFCRLRCLSKPASSVC
jgi:hypothetical protein